jgi:hypothetical protein
MWWNGENMNEADLMTVPVPPEGSRGPATRRAQGKLVNPLDSYNLGTSRPFPYSHSTMASKGGEGRIMLYACTRTPLLHSDWTWCWCRLYVYSAWVTARAPVTLMEIRGLTT